MEDGMGWNSGIGAAGMAAGKASRNWGSSWEGSWLRQLGTGGSSWELGVSWELGEGSWELGDGSWALGHEPCILGTGGGSCPPLFPECDWSQSGKGYQTRSVSKIASLSIWGQSTKKELFPR